MHLSAGSVFVRLRRLKGISGENDKPLANLHDEAILNTAVWKNASTAKRFCHDPKALSVKLNSKNSC